MSHLRRRPALPLACFALSLLLPAAAVAGSGSWTTSYPDGGEIQPAGLVADPSTPGVLYAAPLWNGIYRSTDGGASWVSVTDPTPRLIFDAANTTHLFVDASGRVYAIGGANYRYALARSDDGGASWRLIDDGWWPENAQSVAFDPTDPDVIYEGTSGPNGSVYRSVDAGDSWAGPGSGFPPDARVLALAVDPHDPTTLYAGLEGHGVYKSTDSAASWAPANGGAPITTVLDLALDPVTPGVLYAASDDPGSGERRIFKSTDGAASWSQLAPSFGWPWHGAGRLLALDPADPLHLHAVDGWNLQESTDGGASWAPALVADSQLTAVLFNPAGGADRWLGSIRHGVFRSTDGGVSFAPSNAGLRAALFPHIQSHSLAFDAADPSIVYAGSIHRGYRSIDGGASWLDLAHPAGQTFAFATHPAAPGTVWSSTHDLWLSTDGGASWSDGSGGAFCCFGNTDVAVHPGDPQTVYFAGADSGAAASGVYKTTDGGASWSLVTGGVPNPRLAVLAVDPNDGDVVYAGTAEAGDPGDFYGLIKSTDGGASWSQLGGGLPPVLHAGQIVVHPLDSNLVWVAAFGSGADPTGESGLFRSTDGGTSWSKVLDDNLFAVAVDPTATGVAYAGNWSASRFWRSLDGGATWTLVDAGLPPQLGIDAIAVDPANPARVLIGTTAGAWEITFAGTVELTVNNLADDGPGSLRAALNQANQDGVPNRIGFHPDLAGGTLHLANPLPPLTEGGTTIDGDVDGDCFPDVEIHGGATCCDGIVVQSAGNSIRGLVVNGFEGNGILLEGSGTTGNVVTCNFSGTDRWGLFGAGNGFGVHLRSGASGNVIGGDPVTERNVFSGNVHLGVHLLDTDGNTVAGNLIGVGVDGFSLLPNGGGVMVEYGSSSNTLGPHNVIAWNGGPGVLVLDGFDGAVRLPSEGNTVTRNAIRDNDQLGIDLGSGGGPDGVTANDPGNGDVGPNTLLNFPEFTASTPLGGDAFTLDGTAPPDATVELFAADPDPSGHGEGAEHLGSVVADPGGGFSITVNLPPGYSGVTATATDPAGNTSEFSAHLTLRNPDAVAVGDAAAFQGETAVVPVYIRDRSASPLGVDRPAGERIQAFTVQLRVTPGGSVAGVVGTRAGLTAGLTPVFEHTEVTGDTATYILAFDEGTDPIPFTLDAPAPGELVAELQVTLDPFAPPTPHELSLVATGTVLTNQGGTVEETEALGTLELQGAVLQLFTRAATALYAEAESSSSIRLTWDDPNTGELGFRVERAPDGSSWTPIATLGPDDTTFLDAPLDPGTLYYYRVISFSGTGDNPPSNVATAETFPVAAAKVCVEQLSEPRSWARFPTVAHAGDRWGAVWEERNGSTNDELFLTFLDDAGGFPTTGPVQLTRSDSISQLPTVRWNGSRYGLFWGEHMRGPGGEVTSNNFFALLEPDGTIVRGPVRLLDVAPHGGLNADGEFALEWDGSGWGHVATDFFDPGQADVGFWRFTEDGELLAGPVRLTASPAAAYDVSLAWSGTEYGVAWLEQSGSGFSAWFRRLLPDGSPPPGDPGPVQLWLSSSTTYANVTSVVWDGTLWAVAWGDFPPGEGVIRLAQVDAGGVPAGPVKRLSDDWDSEFPPGTVPPYDDLPKLVALPAGGYLCLTSSWHYNSNVYEIARLTAGAGGDRTGARTFLSDLDGTHSAFARVAQDGGRVAAVYDDGRQGSQEVAALLAGALGGPLGGPHDLTFGHHPGNHWGWVTAGGAAVAPLAGGFVAAWHDEQGGGRQPYLRIYDPGGGVFASFLPLSGRGIVGDPAVTSVGGEFAVAWKDPAGTVVFVRHNAASNPLTGEVEVAVGTGGRRGLDLGWSGEHYGLAYFDGDTITLERLDRDGNPIGPRTDVAAGGAGPYLWSRWSGAGWILLWRGTDGDLHFARVDAHGAVVAGPVEVTGTGGVAARYHAAWGGGLLGVAWLEDRGGTPRVDELYFTALDRDGNVAVPELQALAPLFPPGPPRLLWGGDRFRLFRGGGPGGVHDGVWEDQILPDATLLSDVRQHTNRGVVGDVASDGTTTFLAWGQLRELFVETGACLDDATPPPCPELSVSRPGSDVELAWTPVDDPESGIWRYMVYRDGIQLGESFPGTTTFADGGARPGAVHGYEVRALDGAYLESVGCPVHDFSTATGDTNGDGVLDPADVFYLILYFFAGGDPPQGDADANGDGAVTIADLFYLINYFYGGGPPPAGFTGGEPEGTAPVADLLGLDVVTATPGGTAVVPLRVRDLAGTPLDEGTGDAEIQGYGVRVDFDPAVVESVTFAQAGATAGLEPISPIVQIETDHAVILLLFRQDLALTLDPPEPGEAVGELTFTVRAGAPLGTAPITIDPAGAILVNGDATLAESAARGTLELRSGGLRVVDPDAIFVDGFESGDTSAWSATVF